MARGLRARAVFGFNYCRLFPDGTRSSRLALIDAAGPLFNLILISIGMASASCLGNLVLEIASLHRLEPLVAGIVSPSVRLGQDEYRLVRHAGAPGALLLAMWFCLLCFLTVNRMIRDSISAIMTLSGYAIGVMVGRGVDSGLHKRGYFDGSTD